MTPDPATGEPQTSVAKRELRRICVFCGSSSGEDPRYLDAASRLGAALVGRGLGLVYGGSRVGLMGRLADAVLAGGGEVVGVIPRGLMDREVAHRGLSDLVVTGSMHERKATMVERADGFIAAPGGIGTLEEFFEVLTWSQLGLHRKPCGLLNAHGYFQPLIQLLDHGVREGFIHPSHRTMVLVESSAEPLLTQMERYEPPVVPRWIGPDET